MNKGCARNGLTPLHLAADIGNVEIAQILLEHGAAVNQLSLDFGDSPLFMASSKGHKNVAELLLQHGADVNLATNDKGFTPLYVAVTTNLPLNLSVLI